MSTLFHPTTSLIRFLCCLLTIQSVTAWEYLGQDENVWFAAILAVGVVVVIIGVSCCVKRLDMCASPMSPSYPKDPKDGIYIAEYREPDGCGKRKVHLKFVGDEEDGWTIVPEPDGSRSRKLRVTGGYLDSAGKMWWKEEGPSTRVESYGRYDLAKATFRGTWLATVNASKKDSKNVEPSKSKNVRRVKYTKFYHSGSPPSPPTKSTKSASGRYTEISKVAIHIDDKAGNNNYKNSTTIDNDYVNVSSPDDEVIKARAEMKSREHLEEPPQPSSQVSREPTGALARTSTLLSKFSRRRNRKDRSPSPDPDYVKLEDAFSIGPSGNDDATLNSSYDPDVRYSSSLGGYV